MQQLLPASGPVFSYHRPSAGLAPYVAYYSVQHRFAAFASPQFLPELGGSLILSWAAGGGQSMVWGPFTIITTTGPQPPGLCARCFVEFRPGGLALVVGNGKGLGVHVADLLGDRQHQARAASNDRTTRA